MSEWNEFSAKTVNEALTNALIQLNTTSDKVEYEIIEKETSGILGLFSKPAVIRVRVKYTLVDTATDFLNKVFASMGMEVKIDVKIEDEAVMNIELSGDQMGVLIGKRGATLDSLQYLTSLVINKERNSGNSTNNYMRVKIDTENYRERRKETLENLAKNLAHKVKRIHRPVFLEPMNAYERRVIHSTLQDDKFVETHSEGEEPFRKVVITMKPGVDTGYEKHSKYGNKRGGYHRNGSSNGYHKKYNHSNSYQKQNEEKDDAQSSSSVSEENE